MPGSEQIQHLLHLLLTFNRKIKMCIGGVHFSHTVAHIKRYAVEQLGADLVIEHHGKGAALAVGQPALLLAGGAADVRLYRTVAGEH